MSGRRSRATNRLAQVRSGLLVIMGSGETAPTMVKPHREIFARVTGRAVLIDTPYGFQENADDISSRAVRYFADSTGQRVDVLSWRSAPTPGLARERALAGLRDAGWIFAGPGSPTYALRQWDGTELPDMLVETLERDGVVVFASAAALTLGSHTIPVYEIYKAGIAPHWVPGLDLFHRVTGLPAVVIPHYDNAEGGHHDTRYCYLGERRLSTLESELPDEAFVFGVDEHTAVLLDLGQRSIRVLGNGGLTVRRRGATRRFEAGTALSFDGLVGEAEAAHPVQTFAARTAPVAGSLRADTDRCGAAFDACFAARDVDGCVAAALDLEQALQDWVADTDVSDERDTARAALRQMLVRLGSLAGEDPRELLGPHVETLLELRRQARERGDYPAADWIRGRLAAAGVEVRDTPDGATWSR